MLLSALWGGSFLFLRMISPVLGPVLLIELRVLIAFLVLAPALYWLGKWPSLRDHWRIIALLAVGNMCLPFTLIAWATLSISAGTASILNATVPIFTALSGFLIWKQHPGVMGIAGLLVGFAGVLVLVLGGDRAAGDPTHILAIAAGLSASLLYGVSTNLIARNLAGVSGLAITTGSLFFSSMFLAPAALLSAPIQSPQPQTWVNLLVLSLFCTALAYLMFYRLIARIGAQRTVMVTFLVPVFSVFWGWLLLGEALTTAMLLGCLLIFAGVAMTVFRPLRPRSA